MRSSARPPIQKFSASRVIHKTTRKLIDLLAKMPGVVKKTKQKAQTKAMPDKKGKKFISESVNFNV